MGTHRARARTSSAARSRERYSGSVATSCTSESACPEICEKGSSVYIRPLAELEELYGDTWRDHVEATMQEVAGKRGLVVGFGEFDMPNTVTVYLGDGKIVCTIPQALRLASPESQSRPRSG